MFVDQTSLLLALGFAAFALSTTLFVSWLSARSDWLILTWATGAGVLVAGFAGFSIYAVTSLYPLLWLSNVLLTGGFVVFYGAAYLFTEKRLGGRPLTMVAGASFAAITLPFILGFDALGAIIGNLTNAVLLAAIARKFWQGRREAPLWVSAISGLYSVASLSFVPCAIVIFSKGALILEAPPSGWAEDLNSIVGLVALTGIGALTLAVNQARLARQHREEANTDPLTHLFNRRAMFELFEASAVAPGTAVLAFDLDHFKSINDKHGHAAGDDALKRFAQVLRKTMPANSWAARMGGEEFLVHLRETTESAAFHHAEAIRSAFARETLQGPHSAFRATVSVGLAMPHASSDMFVDLMRRADDALYVAKARGRNRVVSSHGQLAA